MRGLASHVGWKMLGDVPRDPTGHPSERGLRYYRASNAVEFSVLWAIVAALVIGIMFAADAQTRDVLIAVGALGAVFVVLLVWFVAALPALAVRYRRYEIGEDAVFIQRGFFTRRRAIVPFERVQFIRVKRGPVERWFGLATVVLQTSAGNEWISMLDDEVADELQERLSDLARRSIHDI